jgi:hypothetical protein
MKMRRLNVFVLVAIIALLVLLAPGSTPPTAAQAQPASFAASSFAPDPVRVSAALRSAPVMFIENVGQFAAGARFQVRGGNGTIYLADDALWFTVLEKPKADAAPSQASPPCPSVQASRQRIRRVQGSISK